MTGRITNWARRHAQEVYRQLKAKARISKNVDSRYLPFMNPNHPLFTRLEKEAYGTYRHAVMVGSMAGPAATVVDANPDLARVSGYYHDVGKLIRPELYTENQTGTRKRHRVIRNQRDLRTVLEHSGNSAVLAREYSLPEEVALTLAEHHGTIRTRLRLCHQLMKSVHSENLYYPGPLPGSRETAIVMFADSSQAVFERRMHGSDFPEKPPMDFIGQLVKQIGRELEKEEQFSQASFGPAEQELVGNSITWWLYRFYNNLQLFGTPYGSKPQDDGRRIYGFPALSLPPLRNGRDRSHP